MSGADAGPGTRTPAQQERRTILHIALPLTAAYVAEMGMVITDMIIVGRLGSKELAAVGLAGDLFWIFLLIGMGVISIVGVLAAQSFGAGDREGTVAACEQGMVAAAVTSLPVMAGVWLLEPGYLAEDAWAPVLNPARVVTVLADTTVTTPDLPLLPAIIGLHPRPGAQNVASRPELRWTAVAEADSYRVVLDNAVAGVTTVPHLALRPDQALDPGNHLWWVVAETADGGAVGVTDAYQLFRVGPGR